MLLCELINFAHFFTVENFPDTYFQWILLWLNTGHSTSILQTLFECGSAKWHCSMTIWFLSINLASNIFPLILVDKSLLSCPTPTVCTRTRACVCVCVCVFCLLWWRCRAIWGSDRGILVRNCSLCYPAFSLCAAFDLFAWLSITKKQVQ